MDVIVAAATVVAMILLLGSLQWLAGLVRELPAERRPRRAARAAPGASPTTPSGLRPLERLADEALAGDRHAVVRLARLASSAARRCGVHAHEPELGEVTSPAGLLAALDRLEAAVDRGRGGPPTGHGHEAGG